MMCPNCIELSRYISAIDYLLGPPNPMGVSLFDVEQDPQRVVDGVRRALHPEGVAHAPPLASRDPDLP